MFFLLQKQKEYDMIDFYILKDLLDSSKYIHTYKELSIDDFYNIETNEDGKIISKQLKSKEDFSNSFIDAIPLGTIQFVTLYFNIFYGIEKEMPIEIPPILRTNEFLKRKYSIVSSNNIPKKGKYFIKDVSQLKVFSYEGELEFFLYDEIFDEPKNISDTRLHLKKDHLFQVSELIDILSEYRVFVIDNEIYSITNYNGDFTLYPDISLLKKAIMLWSTQKDCPNSYSIDVAITPKGTCILECHILMSTGIYHNINGTKLLYGYKDAKDYLVNYNTPITEFTNF